MNSRSLPTLGLVFCMAMISSCQSSKSTTVDLTKQVVHKQPDSTFKFTLRMKVISTISSPVDEIFIDTSGQMTFETNQQMKTGNWRKPLGFGYLNLHDEDTLVNFIRKNSLFEIKELDIKPECNTGDVLYFNIYRSDLKKNVTFTTNTCVVTSNLLTGEQRKLFPQFITFCQRLREVYRPELPN